MSLDRALRVFHSCEDVSQADLQRRLGLSERQVRRLIAEVRARGVRLHERREGREKRYWLDEADRGEATSVALSERERLALSVAAQAARALFAGTPLAAPLESGAAKVASAGTDPVSYEPEALPAQWGFGTTGQAHVDAEVFEALWQAVSRRETVEIAYTNLQGQRSEGRRLDPYAVALRGSSWLVVGHDHRRGAVRTFSLAAVEAAASTGRSFDAPEGFSVEDHFRDSLGAFTGEAVEEVRLRVSAAGAAAFRRKDFHPTQQNEEGGDGGLVVSFEVAGLDEMAAFARSFGPLVEVLAPAALRARMAAEAEAVCRLYA